MKEKTDIEGYTPVEIPEHWSKNSWEEKARENPLFAVMTTPNYTNSGSNTFTQEELDYFFSKGERVWTQIVKPRSQLIDTGSDNPLFVEYGCGMGRILKPIIADGYRAAGVDISPTMIEHAKALVPEAEGLYALDKNNRSGLKDDSADLVFSFAVLKHIHNLELYHAALDEIMRILKPGGVLVLNFNCQDFIHGSFDNPGRTENLKDRSVHYRHGERKPYRDRKYSTWSGVYISYDHLVDYLAKGGLSVVDRFHHTMKKPQGIWVVATKKK